MTVLNNTTSEGNEKGKATKPKMMLVEKPVYEELALSAVVVDPELQSRVAMDPEHVRTLGRRIADGLPLEPPVVFKDLSDPKKAKYWLADGFHRLAAAIKAGLRSMKVEIKIGTRRDALIYSAGANQKFSLPRKPEDIQKAVFMLLMDEEWQKKTAKAIADHVGIGSSATLRYITKFQAETSINLPDVVIRPDGRPRVRRMMTLDNVPRVVGNETRGFSVNIDRKLVYLGKDRIAAEAKRDRIFADRSEQRVDVSKFANVVQAFLRRSIVVSPLGFSSRLGLPGGTYGSAAIVSADISKAVELQRAIGQVLLARQHHDSSGRAVVICRPQDGPAELLDLARQLGVEFLTPDEFVASVKGDDANSNASDSDADTPA